MTVIHIRLRHLHPTDHRRPLRLEAADLALDPHQRLITLARRQTRERIEIDIGTGLTGADTGLHDTQPDYDIVQDVIEILGHNRHAQLLPAAPDTGTHLDSELLERQRLTPPRR